MADSKKPPASIYANAAQMAGMQGSSPAGGGSAKPGTSAGQQGEKVKNITTLLEVFKKMDQIEDDPDAKSMIQQMTETAQKYLDKVQGGKGPADGKPAASAEPSSAAPPPPGGDMPGGGGKDSSMPVPA